MSARLFAVALALLLPLGASAQAGTSRADQTDADTVRAAPDPRVEAALAASALLYDVEPNGDYRLVFDLESGRSQTAWVRPSTRDFDGLELREVFSIAYVPDDSVAALPDGLLATLLEENTNFGIGAWALEDGAVLFIARLDADATADDLEIAIGLTVDTADSLEQQLAGDADAY